MPGFRHPPGADIQRIRQDLRDRYHDGFPILKELLQNADDAGAAQAAHAATQCDFALCEDGLPGAQHALLRRPGLAVINDGGFTADDANSLTSLGLSNKAGQSAAAGKFGLGLKSVFHWAEAFFYFSPHSFAGDPDIQSSGHDLLNPWSSRDTKTGRHREWDEEWQRTRQADFQAFCSMVSDIGVSQRWFGLWIPLRRQEHTNDGQGTVQPIENRFPAANIDELLGADWRRRVAETLPLLRRVRAVRFCQRSQDAWPTVAEMRVGDDARRMRFGTETGPAIQGANIELSGQIEGVGRSAGVIFRGTESFVALPMLTRLRDHSAWPSQSTLGPDGADLQVKEKAEPHGAVIFTRQAAEGQPALRVHQAVFLPLGEPEQVGYTGMWRYNLYLHGFFFVDSGRRGIQPFDELPEGVTPENAESESQVTQLWNRTLLHELVAPLVLPSLDAFVRQEQMQSDEIESLVRSLVKSELLEKLTDWMCREQRFINRLKKDGSAWTLEAWAATGGQAPRWLKLPEPDFPEAELFELLPTLAHLCGEASVSIEGKPRLADVVPMKPSDEELAGLLTAVAASAFQKAPHLAYLLKLMPDSGADSPLTTALVSLANRLLNQRLPEGKELRDLWNQFFQHLPVEGFICLPCNSTKASPEMVRALAGATLPVAVLWEDYRDADGKGTLDWESLLPLLQSLGGQHLADEVAVRQRSAIVVRLLQACEALPPAWTDTIAKLPLFDARTPSGAGSAASFAELQTASGNGLLFTGGKEWAEDLAKAAPTLKPLLIAQDMAEILDLGSAACGAAACVALLRDAPRLAGDFASRGRLFTRILPAASQHENDSWAALRCLLHGEISAWQHTATLFDETGAAAVLLRLLEKSLLTIGQPWRRIPAALVGQLQVNAEQKQHLQLVPASEANLEALISEVGPAKVDCAELTREDCDYILGRFNDVDVLHGLNIHDTLDGHRVRIGPHTYVDDGEFKDLPEQFNDLVTRLRDRPGYARFANADGSNRLVKKLSWEAVIEIAFDQPEPAHWWDAILTAIGKAGYLRVAVRDRVRSVSWLPRPNGPPAAPDALLDVPGAEEELDRLPDNILAGRIPLLRLAKSVREHERFDTFKSTILPPAKEALATLAALLWPHADWSTGLSGEWSPDDTGDWVKTLAAAPGEALRVAKLAKAFAGNEQVRDSLPTFFGGLGGGLNVAAYAAILKSLAVGYESADTEARLLWSRVLSRYLKALGEGGADLARQVLVTDGVKLVNAGGRTKPPRELTFASDSIHPDDQLDEGSSGALEFLRPAQLAFQEPPGTAPVEPTVTANEMVHALRAYFAPWRATITATDPIGALLSLIGSGPGLLGLSREFFSAWSPDKVLDWVDEHDEAQMDSPIRDRISRRQFKVSIVADTEALVRSVLGNEFRARLAIRPTDLLIGYHGDGIETWQEAGRFICHLPLRTLSIECENLTDEVLVGLLRETAAKILTHALRAKVDARPLFEKLSEAVQLHVRVAQNMIVEQALAFLRQVGAQEHPKVRDALAKWDDARRQEAVEEAHNLDPRRSSELRREARDRIRNLLSGDADVQATVLRGVQRKLSEFQYLAASVPFELWQNADDAVAELVRLGIDPRHAADLGFFSQKSGGDLCFVHWGRPINEFAGPDGKNCRAAGFDRDLEKMLVTAISDKSDAHHPGSLALTGKFGLGFKSVFLVSDAPEILSASVDFVIRGGIYPVRLEDAQRNELLASLRAIAPNDARRGTLIRLPLRTANADDVLGLFRQLAPVLVIFSRRLKRLRFREAGGEQRELRWEPEPLLGGQCEFGSLPEPLGGVTNALTLLSASEVGVDRLTFLIGLNADGFVSLPDDVPVFWVTAPTRATPAYGFAVNGPFEPDVGRVQLALQSEKNRQLAGELAGVLATRLKLLGERSSTGWPTVRDELKLATGASAYDFWNSLWDLLGTRFAAKCRKEDKSPVADLARRILWESEGDGLRWFYRDCATLPTGLWGDYRLLTRLRDLRHVAAGALDRELVFRAVSGWQGFQQRVAVGAICSWSQVASVLERLGVSLREVETVHLATVVEWELGGEKRADADLAAHLGELITPEFMNGLEKGQAGEREEREHTRLVELLRDVSFQAADGSWHKASKLVVAAPQTGVEQDEPMRVAFAPRECQLHPAYAGTALQFFLACRPRLEAGVAQMAEWVLKASDQAMQVAALHYLLDGDLRHDLADGLRPQRDAEKWLWKLESFDWFKTEFSEDQRRELLAHVLKLFEDQLRSLVGTGAGDDQGAEEPPPKHIWTVEELWQWWEQQGKPTAAYTLEGELNWPLFHGGPFRGEQQRKEELKRLLLSPGLAEGNALWYRLFGYACLVSAGRHTTELRRFWLGRLNPERFWERTSSGDFSEQTHELFERAVTAEFNNMDAGGEQAYFWRRVFYDIRKACRMVHNEFPAVLLDLVNQGHGGQLRQFLRTGRLNGTDQPRWIGTFGQSADTPLGFIIRELMRLNVITDESVRPSAFFVCRPVLRALEKIGWIDDADDGFSGEDWLVRLAKDQVHGPLLLPDFDIPLLHMGITHRGDNMPVPPR